MTDRALIKLSGDALLANRPLPNTSYGDDWTCSNCHAKAKSMLQIRHKPKCPTALWCKATDAITTYRQRQEKGEK